MAEKPETIFKYEDFTAQSLQNLKSQSIYFGPPSNFNDPYDCALKAIVPQPSNEEVELMRKHYLERKNLPIEVHGDLSAMSLDELRALFLRSANHALENRVDNFQKSSGVTCFSESNDDLLMWSHYGGRYKGFCLEFSTGSEPFSDIHKVTYSEVMPTIGVHELIMGGNLWDEIRKLYCTKSISWRYEKEWRVIHKEAGTVFTYDASLLKSVYFGPDIDNQCLEIICLILAGQNPGVDLWKGARSEERFEVVFKQFTYTSFLEAKSKGLIQEA